MSNPQRSTEVTGFPAAILAGELPASVTGERPPEWIKATPRGPVTTRDGRRYEFDPEAIVAAFKADGIDIPVDVNHAVSVCAMMGTKGEAIGWATDFDARADGLFAKIDWLAEGRTILGARTHRYVSPAFQFDKTGKATLLTSLSLVASPALPMPALASLQAGAAVATLGAIAQALGLTATDGEAAYLSAISRLSSADARLAALETANHQSAVAALMEGALLARKIVPAERDEYVALCATTEGFAQVQRLFDRKVPIFQGSGLDGRSEPSAGDASVAGETPQMLAARATRYREDQSRAGATLSQSEAITFAYANPNAGR